MVDDDRPADHTAPEDEVPSGMREDAEEATPLGPEETAPDAEGGPDRGGEAMPGIPTDGEPPMAS